jgi:hypothetical protein
VIISKSANDCQFKTGQPTEFANSGLDSTTALPPVEASGNRELTERPYIAAKASKANAVLQVRIDCAQQFSRAITTT